jgi:hypothetical protein
MYTCKPMFSLFCCVGGLVGHGAWGVTTLGGVTSIFDTCLPMIIRDNLLVKRFGVCRSVPVRDAFTSWLVVLNMLAGKKKEKPPRWTRDLILFLLLCQQPLA